MENLAEKQINSEGFFGTSTIKAVDWKQVSTPISAFVGVNLSSQEWSVSPTQLVSIPGQKTYSYSDGTLFQFKIGDGIFEPLYEGIAYEFSSLTGFLSTPHTTTAFTINNNGTIIFGTLSQVLFQDTLKDLSEDQRKEFFSKCDPAALIGESILAVRLKNFDFGNSKFDSIAIGRSASSGSSSYSYYIFDHSHLFWGPREERSDEDLENHKIGDNFWYLWDLMSLRRLDFRSLFIPHISRILNFSDRETEEICDRNAEKLADIDPKNADTYLRMGNKISSMLINTKETFKREMDVFLQGAKLNLA